VKRSSKGWIASRHYTTKRRCSQWRFSNISKNFTL